MRQKACKVCKDKFDAFRSTQIVCSPRCAVDYTAKQRQKRHRQEKREYRERTKPKKSLLTEAQKAFNGYIRIRDKDKPCISCNGISEQKQGGTMEAGHWHSTGAYPELRFTLWNVFLQCSRCNRYLSGNTKRYDAGLKIRFGQEWFDRREQQVTDKQPNHYSKDDLRRIARLFNKKTRLYKKLFRTTQ